MQTLPKKERLCGRRRIGELFDTGAKGATRRVLARALPGETAEGRVAVVAGKKLGNAVKRNRLRRRLRAAYRMQKEAFPPGWDIVLVARAGLLEAKWLDVTKEVELAVGRALTDCTGPLPPRPNR